MTTQQAARLCEQTLSLLFVERDQVAEQVAELRDVIDWKESTNALVVVRGKPVIRASALLGRPIRLNKSLLNEPEHTACYGAMKCLTPSHQQRAAVAPAPTLTAV